MVTILRGLAVSFSATCIANGLNARCRFVKAQCLDRHLFLGESGLCIKNGFCHCIQYFGVPTGDHVKLLRQRIYVMRGEEQSCLRKKALPVWSNVGSEAGPIRV